MTITLEQIKEVVSDLKFEDKWVCDSHTAAEYKGLCKGLDMLVQRLEDVKNNEVWEE